MVIAREAGDYIVATSMFYPGPCQVHELVSRVRVNFVRLLSREGIPSQSELSPILFRKRLSNMVREETEIHALPLLIYSQLSIQRRGFVMMMRRWIPVSPRKQVKLFIVR